MIYTGLNNTGEVEAIYGHLNGVKSEVSEVYGSIGYNDPIFYSRKTITGTSPLTFKGLGQPLKDYHIYGNSYQDGTPSPEQPVEVEYVGDLVESGEHTGKYKIPITLGGVTQNVYLDEPLYGFGKNNDALSSDGTVTKYTNIVDLLTARIGFAGVCGSSVRYAVFRVFCSRGPAGVGASNFLKTSNFAYNGLNAVDVVTWNYTSYLGVYISAPLDIDTVEKLKARFQSFYEQTGERPVLIYPINTATTSTVNVPTLNPTTGNNTLSVDTTVKPSAVSITGNVKPTGYGQLLDVNDVDIQDSTGEPIFIHG